VDVGSSRRRGSPIQGIDDSPANEFSDDESTSTANGLTNWDESHAPTLTPVARCPPGPWPGGRSFGSRLFVRAAGSLSGGGERGLPIRPRARLLELSRE
jgi:hypothetical protein